MNKALIFGARMRAKATKVVELEESIEDLNKRSTLEAEKLERAETEEEVSAVEKSLEEIQKELDEKQAEKEQLEKEIEERSQYTHFQTGMASFYGGSWHGKKTANGEIFNENSLTAAHRTLPFGTRVRVTNLDNGKSVVVRINNRGPYSNGRIIDLSKAAFSRIASTSRGVTRVKLEVSK